MHEFFQTLWQKLLESNLPGVIGGIIILLIGWLIAWMISSFIAGKINCCGHGKKECSCGKAGKFIGRVIFYLLLLVVLSVALPVMQLEFAAVPLREFSSAVAGYLPRIAGAAILCIIAWVIAGIAGAVTAKVVEYWNLEEKLVSGSGRELTGKTSGIAAKTVYAVVWLIFLPSILNALEIHGITMPLREMIGKVLYFIPNILAAALLLALAAIGGRLLAGVCSVMSTALGFDRFTGRVLKRDFADTLTPGRILGKIVYLAVMVFAVIGACEMLNLDKVAEIVAIFAIFGGNVLLSALILLIGFRLADFVAEMLVDKCDPLGIFILRLAVIFFTIALALGNLEIGGAIVTWGFVLILGAMCVAAAIAFGIGGREAAARYLERKLNSHRSAE